MIDIIFTTQSLKNIYYSNSLLLILSRNCYKKIFNKFKNVTFMEDLSHWKEKFEVCIYAKKLLDKLEYLNTKVNNPIDLEEVKKGIYYARKYHGSQMRKSGDPYYSHPIEVAIMLADFVAYEAPKLYTVIMLQAALLHDTIEDTKLTEKMIIEIFGVEVAKHVEGLTRIKPWGKISAEESLNLLVE